jgi:beta-phosphoglucomutase-like phosphatase (HAD superfamily)
MLDAVLLEWEGVLADTGAARRDALLRALADEGVPTTPAASDAWCAGLDAHSAALAALGAAGRDDVAERLADGFSLMPGAAAFMAAIAHRTRLAVATQAGRAETDVALRLAGLDDAIVAVTTADDVTDPPPASALYVHALAKLARLRPAHPTRVVALLHTSAAVRGARAAGVRTLAVGSAPHVAMEADGAVDDLRELTLGALVTLTGGVPAEARR